jgi:murein DD-endopeptidase MepM/ murein hydrolase activator NlpD
VHPARPRAGVVLALLLALLACATPARADSKDVAKQLDELVARLDKAEADEAVATRRLAKIRDSLTRLETELADGRDRVGMRMRALYMTGSSLDPVLAVMSSNDPSDSLERAALVHAATRDDEVRMRRLKVLRRQVSEQRLAADAALRDIEQTTRTLAQGRERLTTLLAQAQREEAAEAARQARIAAAARQRRLAAVRAARQAQARARASRDAAARRAAVAAASRVRGAGGYACLVGPAHAFSDTWGAPRSGGRSHKGVDVFAPYGSPVYAVESGVVVSTRSNSLGGITITLRGNGGDEYYYAHNSANLVTTGERVEVGEHIARVGDSGNAKGTSPHVHFEVHPGGNAPVNPYPFVKRVCG